MSGLSVSGIASGIDSDSIISQMVALETRSIATLQRRIALEEAERLLFQDVSSRLQGLKSATEVFSADTLFSSLSASSSDTSILGVSATSDAPIGTQTIRVLQTARAHRIGGTGVEDATATPIATAFTPTNFVIGINDLLSSLTSADKTITQSGAYDFNSEVSINGTYTGSDNVDVSVELINDYVVGSGTIDLRISTDGGATFTDHIGLAAVGDSVTLTDAGQLDNIGFEITMNNLADLKDNDEFTFRARGTRTLEFQVGNGERQELLIDSETTLSELARQINDDSDLGIRADILNDGSTTNPFRLILTSLTEGRDGEMEILHNSSSINLSGVTAEDPATDSQSYTGGITFDALTNYTGGLDNSNIVLEAIEGGRANGTAKFRISVDGGLTFHDNSDAGFSVTAGVDLDLFSLTDDAGGDLFDGVNPGLILNFTDDNSEFEVGDRITVDLFQSEIQTAQDALINVNGINLVKSTNVIDDVFTGMTLTLNEADVDKTVTVTIAEQAGDITAALSSFVESFNSSISLLQSQSKFDPDEDDSAPLLMGDATIRQIQSSLQRYVTGRISILGGSDSVSSLADLGITTNSETGQLSFDTSKLSAALADDSTAVRRLLSRFGDLIDGNNASFVSSTSATQQGTYEIEVTTARTRAEAVGTGNAGTTTQAEVLSLRFDSDAQGTGKVTSMQVSLGVGLTTAQQVAQIQASIDAKSVNASASIEDGKIVIRQNDYGDDFSIEVESDVAGDSGFTVATTGGEGTDLAGKINGISVTSSDDVLVGSNGFAFEDLRVRITNDFLGDAGTIRLNDGLGSSFSSLLESFVGLDGILSTKIGSFDSTISRIESQVTRVSERASLLETRLRKKFVNLEVTLGKLNATGEFLSAQLKSLPGVQINKK